MAGGTINIADSYEGLEGLSVDITGGDISICASDDGINAAGGADGSNYNSPFGGDMFSVTEGTYASISGGTINVTAMGDGIDSNGALYVTGGTCYVSGPTNSGNGALDYTSEGSISGGVFAATGSVGMAMSFDSSSAQGVIFYCFDAAQPSGSTFTLTDASGAVLAQFTPDNAYQCVVVSAPELSVGESYTLTTGSEAHTITMDSLSYSNGLQQAGMMGFGGGKGGMAYGDMQPPDGSAPQTEGGMQMPSGNFGGKGAQRP